MSKPTEKTIYYNVPQNQQHRLSLYVLFNNFKDARKCITEFIQNSLKQKYTKAWKYIKSYLIIILIFHYRITIITYITGQLGNLLSQLALTATVWKLLIKLTK